jgi:hypothetical protein
MLNEGVTGIDTFIVIVTLDPDAITGNPEILTPVET